MTYEELHTQLAEEYDRIIAETLRKLKRKKPITREKIAKALFKANKAYWTARLALLDDDAVVEAERVARALAVPYAHAAEELSDQVRRVFPGYQSAFNLTQKEAEDLLDHVVYDHSVADNLRTMAAAVTDSEEKTRIMAELSAPAYRYRMQRAEQIAKNAQETLESIARNEIRTDRAFMQTEIEKAYNISLDESQLLPPSDAVIIDLSGQSPQNTGYMPRAEEPVRDFTPTTDRGIMDSFTLVNDKAVKEIIEHEWKDGNFSEKIWSNTDELAREVKQVLLEGELTGASEAKMAAKIEERFHVGMYKARRVIRTESNYCINQAELKGMKDAGFDEYEFISLGENAEDVCDTCDDLNGERFKISEAAVGVNCPPMHPFCRCKVTTPQETLEDIQADIDRMLEGTSIEEIEQRLDMMIAEREQIGTTENSAEGVDKFAENDIINNNETNDDKYPAVTDDDINRVPSMDIFGDNELNLAHEQASRDILEEVKRQQELGAIENGVEISIIYDKDMNEFNGMKYIVGDKDKTEIVDLTVPYHAFHTHPDDCMFSLSDLLNTADRDNMLSLTAQGERGSKYVVVKTIDYDKIGYRDYLNERSKDEIYQVGDTMFSLGFMFNDKDNYTVAYDALSDMQQQELRAAVYNKMDEILTGGENYGVKYYHQETGMAYR